MPKLIGTASSYFCNISYCLAMNSIGGDGRLERSRAGGEDKRLKRPLMSGFRGVLIYIVSGVAATYIFEAQAPGSGDVVGLVFIASTLVAFPWMASRLPRW